jgi:hypothetical protein
MSEKCNKFCAVCGIRRTATPTSVACRACHYKRRANEVCDFMNEYPECYNGYGRNIQGIVMTKALNDLKKSSPRLSPTLTHIAEEIYKKKTWFKFPIIEKDGRYEVGTISTDPRYKKGGKPVMVFRMFRMFRMLRMLRMFRMFRMFRWRRIYTPGNLPSVVLNLTVTQDQLYLQMARVITFHIIIVGGNV